MPILVNLLLLVVLLALSGFFAGAETALFSLSKIEKRRVEKSHPHFSRWLSALLNRPRRTLITILIGNLIVNILATSMVTLFALQTWGAASVGPVLAAFTVILILFGEIVPKVLAVPYNETFALMAALPLRFFSWIIFPFRWVTQKITDAILSAIAPRRREPSDVLSESELMAMIKLGEEEGVLDRQERYMIQKLFELGERPVKDIMTPRIDVKAIDVEDQLAEQIEKIRRFHFTHVPVYKETVDNILGVVSVQDFLLNPDRNIRQVMKQPLFVPETKRIDDLLTEMKSKKASFSVCVDEYGGTAGIVTLEDILEEIFGEYYDEYAQVENPIRSLGRNQYLIEAKISLSDFNEFFSTHLEAEEASSLGGFILEKLGEVPRRGTILETDECTIRIQEVIRQRRIRRVIVSMKK